jgi:hypothetical protein
MLIPALLHFAAVVAAFAAIMIATFRSPRKEEE